MPAAKASDGRRNARTTPPNRDASGDTGDRPSLAVPPRRSRRDRHSPSSVGTETGLTGFLQQLEPAILRRDQHMERFLTGDDVTRPPNDVPHPARPVEHVTAVTLRVHSPCFSVALPGFSPRDSSSCTTRRRCPERAGPVLSGLRVVGVAVPPLVPHDVRTHRAACHSNADPRRRACDHLANRHRPWTSWCRRTRRCKWRVSHARSCTWPDGPSVRPLRSCRPGCSYPKPYSPMSTSCSLHLLSGQDGGEPTGNRDVRQVSALRPAGYLSPYHRTWQASSPMQWPQLPGSTNTALSPRRSSSALSRYPS